MTTLIIGAGPGGYELAALLAAKGDQVTLIERDRVGGTCLNRGCIPTKVMAHAAALVADARSGANYGINTTIDNIDMAALAGRRTEVVDTLRQGVEMLLQRGVNVVKGEAEFTSAREVTVDGESYTADRIVIATGSEPAVLPIPGAEYAMTSDEALQLTEVPESMVIIGGGVIGMEFAGIFAALGSRVTVVEYCKEILPPFDKDIAKRLRTELQRRQGITFVVGAQVTAIDADGTVHWTVGDKESSAQASAVLMAVGRKAVMPKGIELTGVERDRRGIVVDAATLATSVPGIYAIGDVNGQCMLAHAASAQARIVAGEEVDLMVVPSVVFTLPEAAMVGRTEAQCKDAGLDYVTAKALFRGNGKAVTMDETSGMIKLIVDRNLHTILGCHILGPHAADLIMEPTLAMTSGLRIEEILRTIHPHPTLCEAFMQACAMLATI